MSSENQNNGAEESSEIHDASQFLSEDTADANDESPLSVDDIINSAPTDPAAELLADLQRLQAEFVNYKARVERDRDVARNNAIAEVIRAFLPALDDLSRAENHGDLEGSPFAAVVTKLRNAGDKFGLKHKENQRNKRNPIILI